MRYICDSKLGVSGGQGVWHHAHPQSATTCTCTEEPGTRDVKQRNYWNAFVSTSLSRVSLKATFAG